MTVNLLRVIFAATDSQPAPERKATLQALCAALATPLQQQQQRSMQQLQVGLSGFAGALWAQIAHPLADADVAAMLASPPPPPRAADDRAAPTGSGAAQGKKQQKQREAEAAAEARAEAARARRRWVMVQLAAVLSQNTPSPRYGLK